MSNLIKKEGFNFGFDPKGCDSCNGNCCIGESGYIWINNLEIKALSEHLNISIEKFKTEHLDKIGYKYSIKEIKLQKNNYVCSFFDLTKKQCSIYDFRPIQCRTFPFWNYFKNNEQEVFEECPAIRTL